MSETSKRLRDTAVDLLESMRWGKANIHDELLALAGAIKAYEDTPRAPTQSEVFQLAQSKGWHSAQEQLITFLQAHDAPREIVEHAHACWLSTRIALIHAEVSEAMEELRKPGGVHSPQWRAELADIGLRLKDLAEDTGVDLGVAEAVKHATNATREHRHGGKVV